VKVLIRVRVRAGAMPADACIRDISRRGLLLQSAAPPVRGTHIELVGPFVPIVGRVVWTNGHRFGVQTQDVIDVPAFVSGAADRRKTNVECEFHRRASDLETRSGAGRQAEVGRWIQYGAVLLIGAGVATGLAHAAYQQLSHTARSIEAGLR
jgi:hypothetical protein